jgi:hypothetical protein
MTVHILIIGMQDVHNLDVHNTMFLQMNNFKHKGVHLRTGKCCTSP